MKKITKQEAIDLMEFNMVDVESGLEYLHGLETIIDGVTYYNLSDVGRFITR